MKEELIALSANIITVIIALVIVWIYARESFELVTILLIIFLTYVIVRLWLRRRKIRNQMNKVD